MQSYCGKARRKRPLGRPRCKREGNIKIDIRELGSEYGPDSSGRGGLL
jgi:hypothetical protein